MSSTHSWCEFMLDEDILQTVVFDEQEFLQS
jgi:hypothetical protein